MDLGSSHYHFAVCISSHFVSLGPVWASVHWRSALDMHEMGSFKVLFVLLRTVDRPK
jgi:hypothetical protein